jgi:hypothetical protein
VKTGRFTLDEVKYIKENFTTVSADVMGAELDRDPRSVEAWLERNMGTKGPKSDYSEGDAIKELKRKPYWADLVTQFNEAELKMFSFHWKKMWIQFKDDVFHTEEIQIVDTIKLEILMNRALRSQSENIRQVEMIDVEIAKKRKQLGKASTDAEDREIIWKEIINLERQRGVLDASREAISRDFKDLQTKKAAMIKDLKGTREQRVKAIEDSKQTFGALIKRIITDDEFRREAGYDMEKMRLSIDKERARLAADHTYCDGTVDQPFLIPETVHDV